MSAARRPTNCGTSAAALTDEQHRPDCQEPRDVVERERISALVRAARRWHATMSDEGGPADEQMAADFELAAAVEALTSEPQQPRDLAGRIRETLRRIMPEPHVTRDGVGRTIWEGVVAKADGSGLRIGLDWTRDASALRHEKAIDFVVEAIVRECAQEAKR